MGIYQRADLTAQVPIIKPAHKHNKTQKQHKYTKKKNTKETEQNKYVEKQYKRSTGAEILYPDKT